MVSLGKGQSGPGVMTAATEVEIASGMVTRIENKMAGKLGFTVAEVRPIVARKLATSQGTVLNIRKQRRKTIPASLMDRIIGLLIEVAQEEMLAIEHEIATARQVGFSNRDGALVEARARAAALQSLLETEVGSRASGGSPR